MDNIKKIYDPIDVDDDYFAFHESEQNELYTKINQLPESVEDILFGINTAPTIQIICQSYQLNNKQSEELSRLIRKILVTEAYLGDIVQEITNRLAIGPDVAKEIANKIITNLFAPALEDLKRLHMEKFGGRPTAPPPPPVQTKQPEQNINPNNVLDLRK